MPRWKNLVRALAIPAVLTATGCSKIYFHNGPELTAEVPPPAFHHIGVIGLVEFSQPENLKEACMDKEWSAVLTQLSFIQGLVGSVTYGMYTPWGISSACK